MIGITCYILATMMLRFFIADITVVAWTGLGYGERLKSEQKCDLHLNHAEKLGRIITNNMDLKPCFTIKKG